MVSWTGTAKNFDGLKVSLSVRGDLNFLPSAGQDYLDYKKEENNFVVSSNSLVTKWNICETGREIMLTDKTIDKNVTDQNSRVYGIHHSIWENKRKYPNSLLGSIILDDVR